MKSMIPWLMAAVGVGFATWAVSTDGGYVSWKAGRAPSWLGGAGWAQGNANIQAA